jgi:hypothetical protein
MSPAPLECFPPRLLQEQSEKAIINPVKNSIAERFIGSSID